MSLVKSPYVYVCLCLADLSVLVAVRPSADQHLSYNVPLYVWCLGDMMQKCPTTSRKACAAVRTARYKSHSIPLEIKRIV